MLPQDLSEIKTVVLLFAVALLAASMVIPLVAFSGVVEPGLFLPVVTAAAFLYLVVRWIRGGPARGGEG